jgi:hypothetical protein
VSDDSQNMDLVCIPSYFPVPFSVSTLRAGKLFSTNESGLSLTYLVIVALELKAVFEKLQQAEQSGLSQEAIRKLEEQAAEQVR